jgi:glycosyltransferase involved in cell wall biosynthesis
MDYQGPIADWTHVEADVLLIGDPPSFSVLKKARGRVYVWVIGGGRYLPLYRAMEGHYPMLVNHRRFLEHFPRARLCEGGVDVNFFRPKHVRVGYQAGRGPQKGEDVIVHALTGLAHVELVPISGLGNETLRVAYHSLDWWVCAEVHEGWPNMAAEALASGLPVVSVSANTTPLEGVIHVQDLRRFFENPASAFSWERVCDRLEKVWREDGVL